MLGNRFFGKFGISVVLLIILMALLSSCGARDAVSGLTGNNTTQIWAEDVPNANGVINSNGTYTVAQGDTMFSIAAQFGCNIVELRDINGIADANVLSVGQVLNVQCSTSPNVAGTTGNSAVAQPDTNLANTEEQPAGWSLFGRSDDNSSQDEATSTESSAGWNTNATNTASNGMPIKFNSPEMGQYNVNEGVLGCGIQGFEGKFFYQGEKTDKSQLVCAMEGQRAYWADSSGNEVAYATTLFLPNK